MKKPISLLLICMLFVGLFAINAGAAQIGEKSKQISINEYQLIKKLQEKSVEELKNCGFTDSQIEEIKSINYAEKLRERAKLSEDTLVAYGYSKDQIDTLKNFKGTEDEMSRLSGSVNLVIDENSYLFYYGDYTYFKVMYSWAWDIAPVYSYVDCIGFGWVDTMFYTPENTPWDSYNKVKYYKVNDGSYVSTLTYEIVRANKTAAAISEFDLNRTISSSNTWAKEGYGQIYLRKQGTEPHENQIIVSYGHSTIDVTPGISTGGLSLSFTSGVDQMDYDTFYDEIR